jgi:hypothetical protein
VDVKVVIFDLGRTYWALRWRLTFPTDILVIVIVKALFPVIVITPTIAVALHRLGIVFWRGIGARRFLPR